MASGKWTEEQLKLAFYLYCQIPFGRLHKGYPEIIALAQLIGRTPSAVALKLVNFASLDPSIRASRRKGMGNASALDHQVWDEFNADWEGLTLECERIRERLAAEHSATIVPQAETAEKFALDDYTGETRTVRYEQRVGQPFFRKAVLSSYGSRCCMSGLAEPKLLIASHIVPWREDKNNRLNPSNGLCLSVLHDKAFDCGLLGIRPDYSIAVSSVLLEQKDNVFALESLIALEGKSIQLPERFLPDAKFLNYHLQDIFIGG